MAAGNVELAAPIGSKASTRKPLKVFLGRYFYLCMSLAMAALVVSGFSHTVNPNLFHGNPPRPLLLWVHGAAFSTWVLFFILQSSLVRVRKVSVHRLLGWFGAGLAAVMVVLGASTAVVMSRFDTVVLHQKDADAFVSVPLADMIIFGACIAMAIYWRKRPEFHRRLIFIATCELMDAAVGRLGFWFTQNWFYVAVDLLILLGILRDRAVNGRVNKVYLYALPAMIAVQSLAVYAWRVNPAWWQTISHAIVGF